MKIDELKPGDVLVLSGQKGCLISEAIMLLTGAPVSHAAMVFLEPQDVVEEKPPAIAVHKAHEAFAGRTVYVNRLDPGPRDMQPVLDAARGYLNEEEPYAMSNLYLVGLLLIYKRFTPDTLTKRVMIKVLKKVTAGIIDYVNARKAPGKLPMVCSQFVYQCFEDAGDAYRLRVNNPLLGVRTMAAGPAAQEQSTLDRVIGRVRGERGPAMTATPLRAPAASAQTEDEVLAELCDALRSEESSAGEQFDDELTAAVESFAHAAHAMHAVHAAGADRESGPEVLMRAARATSPHDALGFLKSQEACFVTPADLLDRCGNLTRVGTIPA